MCVCWKKRQRCCQVGQDAHRPSTASTRSLHRPTFGLSRIPPAQPAEPVRQGGDLILYPCSLFDAEFGIYRLTSCLNFDANSSLSATALAVRLFFFLPTWYLVAPISRSFLEDLSNTVAVAAGSVRFPFCALIRIPPFQARLAC